MSDDLTNSIAAFSLANDLIWGAGAIGKEIGVDERKAFYLLERGNIPGQKIGGLWVASRSRLRRHFLGKAIS